jgi:exodeoxyribonuclease VII large subunit
MSRRVEHSGGTQLEIRFPFDRALVDRIKSLPRRRWNASGRFWSVPVGSVVELVEALAPEGFLFDSATQELYRSGGGSLELGEPAASAAPLPPFADAPPKGRADSADELTVGALNRAVSELIAGAFPAPIWLVGEISGFNKSAHRRHVGFELVERDEDGQVQSKVSAILFERTRRELEQALEQAGAPFQLEDEITVRFQVRVDLFAAWGQYRIVVEQIDVNYTLGEAARRREEIVRTLTLEGLHELNSRRPIPAMPLRIGLITSLHSDAYNDLLRSFSESGFAFNICVHGARVQGHSTEPSVLNALDWFEQRAEQFDLLLICRGGGSRTDLVWFDSETLGRRVAQFPLPIIVGIGHEQDRSVLDALTRSCKTPTAAAAYVVAQVTASAEQLERVASDLFSLAQGQVADERRAAIERAQRLVRGARLRLDLDRRQLSQFERQCRTAANVAIRSESTKLERFLSRIPKESTRRIDEAALKISQVVPRFRQLSAQRASLELERLESRSRRLQLVDPQRVLERGYAILRNAEGAILLNSDQTEVGATVQAELADGRLHLKTTKIDAGEE